MKNSAFLLKLFDRNEDKTKSLDDDKELELKMLEDEKKYLKELYDFKKREKSLNDEIYSLRSKLQYFEEFDGESEYPDTKNVSINESYLVDMGHRYYSIVMLQQERDRMLKQLSHRDNFDVEIKIISFECCMLLIVNKDINFAGYYTLESFSFGLTFCNHMRRSLRNVLYETPTESNIIELERKIIKDIRDRLFIID